MKYVVIAALGQGEFPVLFPDDITHAYLGRMVVRAVENSLRIAEVKIVAAGFINHHGGEATGNSESLNMKSRPEDTALIQKHFPGVGRKA